MKTQKEREEHQYRAMVINNQLGEEYGAWFGRPVGRYLALGEYIVELCKNDPHDEWFDAAKEAYLKWKKMCGYDDLVSPK